MSKVICPGSFNPITLGHLNLFERCSKLFDEVVVAVTPNSAKTYLVTAEQRAAWIARATAHLPNVKVDVCTGLLAEYAVKNGAVALVKGLRNPQDMDIESQMYFGNREISGGRVDTVFLPTDERYTYLSSTIVRDIAGYGGSIRSFVPDCVAEEIAAAYLRRS